MSVRFTFLIFVFIISFPLRGEDKLVVPAELGSVKSKSVSRTARPAKPGKVNIEERPDRLKLLNGDSITGQFQGSNDGYLLWQHPSFTEPVQIVTRDVSLSLIHI